MRVQREEADAQASAQGLNTGSQLNLFWVKKRKEKKNATNTNEQPRRPNLAGETAEEKDRGRRAIIAHPLPKHCVGGLKTVIRLFTCIHCGSHRSRSPQACRKLRRSSPENMLTPITTAVGFLAVCWCFLPVLLSLFARVFLILPGIDSSFCFSVYPVCLFCTDWRFCASCGFHLPSTHYLRFFFFSFGSCFIYT